jgi:hypothetical protein
MLLLVFLIVLLWIGGRTMIRRKTGKKMTIRSGAAEKQNRRTDGNYSTWLAVFREQKRNIKEFDLFGTKAAIAWNDEEKEVTVICITEFRNGKPATKQWDYFDFDVEDKYWPGASPRGSAKRIREELKALGLV